MKNYLDLETAQEYMMLVDSIQRLVKDRTYVFDRTNTIGALSKMRLIVRSRILDAIYRLKSGMTPEIQFSTPLEDIIQIWMRVRARSRPDLMRVRMPDIFYPSGLSIDDLQKQFGLSRADRFLFLLQFVFFQRQVRFSVVRYLLFLRQVRFSQERRFYQHWKYR